jgi:hypothetical protein
VGWLASVAAPAWWRAPPHQPEKEAPMSDIRRVVTGLDAEDRAVVQFDSQVALEPGPFGINSVNLWITDSYPAGFSFTQMTPCPGR